MSVRFNYKQQRRIRDVVDCSLETLH